MLPKITLNLKPLNILVVLLGFVASVIFIYVLIALKSILIPITFAVFLTFLFHPIIIFLSKYKIPKVISIIFILILIAGLSFLFGFLIYSSFTGIEDKVAFYADQTVAFLNSVLAPFNTTITEVAKMFNIQPENFDFATIIKAAFSTGIIQETFSSFTSFIGNLLIILVFWIFMIYGKTQFDKRLEYAFGRNGSRIIKTVNEIDKEIQSYLLVKTILNIISASISLIIFLIYGIDFAFVWALLIFALGYIPNIGSVIGDALPIIMSLLQYGLGVHTISMAILTIGIKFIIGNFVEPIYMGRRMDLGTTFVLIALAFWGWVWGIVGMFLAVPISSIMKIIFTNIEPLKPLAILMGSKIEDQESNDIKTS
ncbi:MAG: AI-2E family transporter [Ignavibacterium sp.]